MHMGINNKKDSRITSFLLESLLLLIIVSVMAFMCLGFYMSKASRESIDQVGNLYMQGIDEQLSLHFQTLIDLKLEQADSVVKIVLSDTENADELRDELIYRIRVRDFDYLALCSEDGYIEMLYGEQLRLEDPEPFHESLRRGENKVAVGSNVSGDKVVLFGIAAEYPMQSGGTKSMAVLTALPLEYISTVLDAEDEGTLMYSYIIRKDGTFITNETLKEEYPDYFSSLYERFPEDNKKAIDKYIRELSDAMEKGEDYTTSINLGGNRLQIYCDSLPNSEWHLLTVLPFGDLNKIVEGFGVKRTVATTMIFSIILVTLLWIFWLYFKMSRQQVRELEEAHQEALRANQAKREFLSNMSHDIRTPMNAIVGMTSIAMTHIDDREQVENCLKKITLSGRHLLGLINDVLDMSKIESGKMTLTSEKFSLREIVEGVADIVQSQVRAREQRFNIHISNIFYEDVYCDSVRLNQILLNLLSNSVKYTPEGGTIELSLYQDETSPLGDNFVRTHIVVSDNGIGMTEDFLEHIFDSYSRADNKRVQRTEGAGLGMTITKYIVDAMEGTIDIKSELHKGSEFHVTLDFEKADTEEADMFLPACKALVVDDDKMLCLTVVKMLASMGTEAEWTLSGKKAIEMVRKSQQAGEPYQIILLDWKISDLDGIRVAAQIRQIVGMDTLLIMISSYDWSDFEEQAIEAGINGFLSKPLFKSTLYYGLKKYLGAEEEQNDTVKEIDFSGYRILVAEDNEINWEIINELLSDIGIELEWAENGKVCVEKFQNSEEDYYDLIFMDLRMPIMNGLEAAEAIRNLEHPNAQEIPIIAMTADAFSEDIKRCIDCGMNAHTAKPVNFDEVVSLLDRFLLQ